MTEDFQETGTFRRAVKCFGLLGLLSLHIQAAACGHLVVESLLETCSSPVLLFLDCFLPLPEGSKPLSAWLYRP